MKKSIITNCRDLLDELISELYNIEELGEWIPKLHKLDDELYNLENEDDE